ncbi:unnamed protein product [[Actinomadura] parvosata subsp. kistnae]|nr:unnamed protein product [Actinomadura parvosata subsp. kistnae]
MHALDESGGHLVPVGDVRAQLAGSNMSLITLAEAVAGGVARK